MFEKREVFWADSTGFPLSKSKSFYQVFIKLGEYVGVQNVSTKFYNQPKPLTPELWRLNCQKNWIWVSALQVKYPAPKNVVIAIEFTESRTLVHPNVCSTNVWGNNFMGEQMSGVVIQRVNKVRPWQKSQVNTCPGKQMSIYRIYHKRILCQFGALVIIWTSLNV